MLPGDVSPETVEVWACNWPAVRLFARMSNQWREGFRGETGMDYSLALALMDRMKLDDKTFDEMLDALYAMECAALEEMRKE